MTVDEALAQVAAEQAEDDMLPSEAAEVLAAEVRRLRALDWQPIETADRSGQGLVDIWVVPPAEWPFGTREPLSPPIPMRAADACPAYEVAWESRYGGVVTGIRHVDGSITPDDTSPAAYRATHWRPIVGPGGVG